MRNRQTAVVTAAVMIVGLLLVVSSWVLASPAAAVDIDVIDNEFVSDYVVIHAGDTVRWTNKGSNGHNVASVNGFFPSNAVSDEPWVYEWTFTEPGFYEYVCEPHAILGMTGIIEVLEPAPTPTATFDANVFLPFIDD